MTKAFTALAAAATIGLASVSVPTSAEARHGGALAAGIIGGLAVGALIGSAASGAYYGGPYYVGPAYRYYRPRCWWRRERVWDGYGWRRARVRVCR